MTLFSASHLQTPGKQTPVKGYGNLKPKLLASAILIASLAGCSDEMSDTEYLERAQQAAAADNHQELLINLKNALQQNPKNQEARFLLGAFYLEQYQGAAAEKELSRALEYGRAPESLTLPLAKALHIQRDYQQLLRDTSNINSIAPEDRAEARFYRGLTYVELRQVQDALLEFKTAQSEYPEHTFGQLSKAYSALLERDLETASSTLEDILQANPEAVQAYLLKSRVSAAQGDFEAAIAALDQAIGLQPNNLQLHLDNARMKLGAQQFRAAEEDIDFVLSKASNYPPALIIKSSLRLEEQDWEAARQYAEQAIANSRDNKQAKLIAGMANFYLENWEIARKHLLAVKGEMPSRHIAHRMLTFTELKMGYERSGDEVLNSLGELSDTDSALVMTFAAELAKDGEYADAEQVYSTLADNTGAAETLTKLGILRLHQENDAGIADLQKALEKQPDFDWARAALADAYVQKGEDRKAIETVEQYIELKPDSIQPYLLAANTYLQLQQPEKAQTHIDSALAISNDNADAHLLQAAVARAQNNSQQVQASLEEAVQLQPDNLQALSQLYRVYRQQGEDQQAISLIDDAQAQFPDNQGLAFLKAMAEVDMQLIDKGLATLRTVSDSNTELYSRAQRIAGALELRRNQPKAALQHFQNWQQAAPDDVRANFAVAQAHARNQQPDKALQSIEAALNKQPGNKVLKLAQVRYLIDLQQIDRALTAATEFQDRHGQSAAVELMLGSHYAKQNDYTQALEHFRRSHDINPSSRAVVGLAELHLRTGNTAQAKQLLDDWLSAYPKDQVVSLYRANLALNQSEQNDLEAAIQQYSTLIATNPDNLIAQNNLAWSLVRAGRLEQALTHAKLAFELAPNNPSVQDTYGYMLLRNGQIDPATRHLQQAHQAKPEDPTVAYHYAMALYQNDERQAAKQLLEEATSSEFAEKPEALELLQSMHQKGVR